ncbi:hypothetical protein Bbelb_071150 [Branchiostoma belcheri]|nr:hypothetical protein Bbelb_071150 [Branchiostoma belcheri]
MKPRDWDIFFVVFLTCWSHFKMSFIAFCRLSEIVSIDRSQVYADVSSAYRWGGISLSYGKRQIIGVDAYERATYGLRESNNNFTILTCNCCTDSARSTCVPRTVLASSVLTPHFPVDLLHDHAEHTCTIPVYKDNLTGDCQLVSKMPRKAQKKTTRQDPKKRAAEDTRAASDDEVNRRCTHLQRAIE